MFERSSSRWRGVGGPFIALLLHPDQFAPVWTLVCSYFSQELIQLLISFSSLISPTPTLLSVFIPHSTHIRLLQPAVHARLPEATINISHYQPPPVHINHCLLKVSPVALEASHLFIL